MRRHVVSVVLLTLVLLGQAPDASAEHFHLSRSGFITDFLILGPIQDDDADDRGWRETLALEHLDRAAFWFIDPAINAPIAGHFAALDESVRIDRRRWNDRVRERARDRFVELRWEHLRGSGPEVDLDFNDKRRALAFLFTELEVAEPFNGWLLLGCDDDLAVWIDGVLLPVPPFPGWMTRDQHWLPLSLPPGRHSLLIKSYNSRGRWAVAARLLDHNLGPPDSVSIVLPGVDVSPADLLERVSVDVTPVVADTGLVFEFQADLPTSRPAVGGVLCMSSGGPTRQRCLPIEAFAAAPRQLRVAAPTDEFTRAGLTLTLATAGARPERVVELDVLPHEGSVHAIGQARKTLERLEGGELDVELQRGSAESFAYEIQLLEMLVAERDQDDRYLRQLATVLDRLSSRFQMGEDPYLNRTGHYIRAYGGQIDGRPQPYAVYVPDSYVPDGSFPLVVSLHGLRSPIMMNLRQVLGFDRDEEEPVEHAVRHFPTSIDENSAVFVCPYGYGDTLFRFMGEVDVLTVIDEATSVFRTDPRRTYLTGLSMGGNGSFDLSVHFSDRFAAVLSLAGSADMRRYTEFRRHPSYQWELTLADEYGAMAYAVNAANLPVFAVHGLQDRTHYSHSRLFIERLVELGYMAELETPDLEHNVWRTTYADNGVLERLGSYQRPDFPGEVRLTTPSYRYASSFWVQIDELEQVHTFGTVDTEIRRHRGGRLVAVETSRVIGLSLSLGDAPTRWREDPVTVEVDGVPVCTEGCWRTLHLRLDPTTGTWIESQRPTLDAASKHRGLSGPIRDVWYGPMALIYGTRDPSQATFLRHLAHRERGLNRRSDVQLPVLADTDVTADLVASHHLILYGTSTSNQILADIEADLPIRVQENDVVIGDRLVEGEDLTAIFIHPNPLNPSRYVVVASGTSPPALDAVRWAPRYLPDFVVYDGSLRVNMPDQRTFRGQPIVAGGFLGSDWSLPEASEWLRPAPVD